MFKPIRRGVTGRIYITIASTVGMTGAALGRRLSNGWHNKPGVCRVVLDDE